MSQLLAATRKGLFILERNGSAAWSQRASAFLGDNVTLAYQDPRDGWIYATLNHGHFGVKLHRSQDGGATWQEIASPAYPPFPEGRAPDRCPMRQIEIAWNLQQIWAFAAGGRDQPGRLWCGTIPGGLFKSDDHGASWTIVNSLWDRPERTQWFGGGYDYPGIHSVCVDPRDSRVVTVGVSCGGIWRTDDDGATWSQAGQGLRSAYMPPEQAFDVATQDPHILVNCPGQPDGFWVQHHNGVFVSRDGARSFVEVDKAGPSVFGFACAVHPADPDTAWLAPAIKDEKRIPVDGKLVITRTRDGGKSFDVLSDGLPSTPAYDLVYRHCLAVDGQGQSVAFGSTTGNVWASADQGDHWTTAASNLPPVYSLSFLK